jgi:hypothetical protein
MLLRGPRHVRFAPKANLVSMESGNAVPITLAVGGLLGLHSTDRWREAMAAVHLLRGVALKHLPLSAVLAVGAPGHPLAFFCCFLFCFLLDLRFLGFLSHLVWSSNFGCNIVDRVHDPSRPKREMKKT